MTKNKDRPYAINTNYSAGLNFTIKTYKEIFVVSPYGADVSYSRYGEVFHPHPLWEKPGEDRSMNILIRITGAKPLIHKGKKSR